MRFFDKAMQANSILEKVTMDKSGATKSAIDEINDAMEVPMLFAKWNTSTTSLSKTTAQWNE